MISRRSASGDSRCPLALLCQRLPTTRSSGILHGAASSEHLWPQNRAGPKSDRREPSRLKANPNIEIRAAEASDADTIARILAEAFAEYRPLYTAEAYAATTPKSDVILNRFREGQIWVALLDEQIVGTVSAVRRDADVHIRSMAVLPKARGNRIGERFLEYIENFAARSNFRRLTLSTTPFLQPAVRLYERFGFVRNGTDDLHGTPLITMEKNL